MPSACSNEQPDQSTCRDAFQSVRCDPNHSTVGSATCRDRFQTIVPEKQEVLFPGTEAECHYLILIVMKLEA